jgi:hypothetical protein
MQDEPSIPNIDVPQRRRRLVSGVASLAASAVLLFALYAAGAAPAWRLMAALPVWAGALGVLQAREKT